MGEKDDQRMKWLYFLQSIRRKNLDKLMVLCTTLGNKGFFWILTAGLLCVFKGTRTAGLAMLMSLAMSVLVGNVLLKNIVARCRPCWIEQDVDLLIPMPKDYSFPSGHTYASFAAAFSILPFLNPVLVAAALLIAALIGFSRMYLFVHFLSDILVSVALGAVTGLTVAFMFL